MKECKQCGGTGLIINNKYCRCSNGKFKKALDSSNEQVNKALKEAAEDQKKMNEAAKVQPIAKVEKPKKPKFEVGEWVERHGLLCMVDGVTTSQARLVCMRDMKGKALNQVVSGWAENATIKPAPLEGQDVCRDIFVDLALSTHDEQWFKQLTKAGAGVEHE